MQKGLVTVVLPIYNVEKYLNTCIESVVSQTYRNIEILLIDDGSPDNCPQICEEWALKDTRIKVIHKENAGLGMARNTGIENASGEYICFFDSDDFIDPTTVEKAYALATKEGADVVVFGMKQTDNAGMIVQSFVPPKEKITYAGSAVLDEFLPEYIAPTHKGDGIRFYMSSCMMLCSMETIFRGNWGFVSEREIVSEDVYSLLSLFKYVKKVAVLPEALYYYRVNEQSLSRGYKKDRYKKIKHFYTESIKLCQKLGYGEEIMHRVSKPYLSFTIAAMKQECIAPYPKKERKKNLKAIIDDEVLQQVLKRNKKDKVSGTRQILFFVMRNKLYNICFWLLKRKA